MSPLDVKLWVSCFCVVLPNDDVVTVRNISVITLDSDAPNSTRAAYVGANNSDLGVQIGKELSLMSPKKKEASMQL